MAVLCALEAHPLPAGLGLALLSLILAAVLVGLGGEVLTGPSSAVVLLLVCAAMLAAVATVTIHLASSRRWGPSSGSPPFDPLVTDVTLLVLGHDGDQRDVAVEVQLGEVGQLLVDQGLLGPEEACVDRLLAEVVEPSSRACLSSGRIGRRWTLPPSSRVTVDR